MKDRFRFLKDIIWLTQLGISVAAPPTVFILLAVWLKNSCGWGGWVMIAGILLGIAGAIGGLTSSLKQMKRSAEQQDKPGPVSFNDHK